MLPNDTPFMKSSGKQSMLVFFVPGIMGSTLRLRSPGRFGEPLDEEVWGTNISSNIDLIASHPERLASPYLKPGAVIDYMKGWGPPKDVYGTLLEFCTARTGLALTKGENFFPFAYDWRADNRETARKFAAFIRMVDPMEDSRLRIIAHSMGGIVTRLMLLEEKSISTRTDLFFQIASPIQGSVKAYYTLKKHLRFHWLLDKIWEICHQWDPDRRAQLQHTLQSFPSLYQLLPPPDIKALYDQTGKQYSALDFTVWQRQHEQFLLAALDVHNKLTTPLNIRVRCVYACTLATDIFYQVDNHYTILGIHEDKVGDGTVMGSSAFAHSNLPDRCLIDSSPCNHSQLCQNTQVFALLKREFAETV
jgi:hypothetical protein